MKKNSSAQLIITILVVGWFLVLIMLPIYGIVQEALKNGMGQIIASLITPEARHAFLLTFWITLAVVVINTVFGVIMALVLVKHYFKGKLLIEGLLDLPFAVSPVVAGFMFIILFGPQGWIGSWFESHGMKIIYALPGMILVTLFVTIPFVAREVIPVLREVGLEQDEAAHVLGASRWQTFWKVTVPSIKWGLIYGITLTVARAIGEFGAVIVIGGNIINRTQTATLHIHQQFTDFEYCGAYSASLLLAIVSFAILIIMQTVYKRTDVE
ncbi:MAG: sulfate ABC transporter permease subunit [Proteobacteria bacterium]|nr:sulfate ABC transporter permease subunit [Pseudomonadota bacterium]